MGTPGHSFTVLLVLALFSTSARSENPYIPVHIVNDSLGKVTKTPKKLRAIINKIPVKCMEWTEHKFNCADFAFAFQHVCEMKGLRCRQMAVDGVQLGKQEGHVVNLIYENAERDGYVRVSLVDAQTNDISATWEVSRSHWTDIPASAWDKVYNYYTGPAYQMKITSIRGIVNACHDHCDGEIKIQTGICRRGNSYFRKGARSV